MNKKQIKTVRYKRYNTMKQKLFDELIKNWDVYINDVDDPITKRILELGREKHLPLSKATEIAEKEFSEK